MNTLAGPAAGAALIAVAFSAPFVIDAITFAVSAALIYLLPRAQAPASSEDRKPWRQELSDGFRWLWDHDLLRPLAIILGLFNSLGMITGAGLILYAQEVLRTSPLEFAILVTGGAAGGIIGGWTASWTASKLGSGPSLWAALLVSGVTSLIIGMVSLWPVVWVMFAISSYFAVLWNVITVSLRQSIIPERLLGRVNGVYRFFAWGAIPVGALIGGLIIAAGEQFTSRTAALRLPWFASGLGTLVLLVFVVPILTTNRIEAAREAGTTSQ